MQKGISAIHPSVIVLSVDDHRFLCRCHCRQAYDRYCTHGQSPAIRSSDCISFFILLIVIKHAVVKKGFDPLPHRCFILTTYFLKPYLRKGAKDLKNLAYSCDTVLCSEVFSGFQNSNSEAGLISHKDRAEH